MKQQQRMKVMNYMTRKIKAKGRMDANNRWWVSAECEKAWIHGGWEDTMQKRYDWLGEMKKKDEVKKMEEEHQKKVSHVTTSADGSAGLLHRITKPTAWRGGVQRLKKEEEDARPMELCDAKRKEWARHRRCDAGVQNKKNDHWKMKS